MHTEVAPCKELASGSPNDEVLAEHPSRYWAAVLELFDNRDGVPIFYENRVIDHRCYERDPMGTTSQL
jgi:hypothetical protein